MTITKLERPSHSNFYTEITRVDNKWLPKQSSDCTYRKLYLDTPGAYNAACDNALHLWKHEVLTLKWHLPWAHQEKHNVRGSDVHPQKIVNLWYKLHATYEKMPYNVDKYDEGYSEDTPPAATTLSAWYFVKCPYLTGEHKVVEVTFKIYYIQNESRYGKFWEKKCTGQITIDKVPTREPLSVSPEANDFYAMVAEFINYSKIAEKLAEAWPPPYKYV